MAERRRQNQMGTHPRAAGLDSATVDPAHIAAASALSLLPQAYETARPALARTSLLTHMSSSSPLARRPLEIPRWPQRPGLVRLHPPPQMNTRSRRATAWSRPGSAQLTSKPKTSPTLRRLVGESSPWDAPPEMQKQ